MLRIIRACLLGFLAIMLFFTVYDLGVVQQQLNKLQSQVNALNSAQLNTSNLTSSINSQLGKTNTPVVSFPDYNCLGKVNAFIGGNIPDGYSMTCTPQ